MKNEKMFLVSRQWNEEVTVFGVFSESTLETALNQLAKQNMGEARKALAEIKKWYENLHLPYYKGKCQYGCEHMPAALSLPLLEFSSSMFNVKELESDRLYQDGTEL